MDRYQNLITFTVDSNRVIIISILIWSRCELNIYVFSNTGRQHTFLIVSNFEIGRLRGQYVESLRSWGVVQNAKFHGMGFIGLKPCKFDNAWHGCEKTVSAHRVISVFLGQWMSLVCFGFRNNTSL